MEVQRKHDKYLFINPQRGSWLKVNQTAKQLVDRMLSHEDVPDVDARIKTSVFNSFRHSGMIESPDDSFHSDTESIKSVYLIVTKSCNLTCDFCSMGSGPWSFEQLSTCELKHTIDKLAVHKVGRLVITGGEPFMRRDIQEIIDYAYLKLNCKIIVSSNGLLLTAKKIAQLKGKLDRVDISVENIYSDDNNSTTKRMKSVIASLQKNEIGVCLSYVLTKQNWQHVFPFLDYVNASGVGFSLKIVAPVGSARNHQHLFDSEDSFEQIYLRIFKYIHEQGYAGRAFHNFVFPHLSPSYGCSAKDKILCISSDGKVYSCHSLLFPEFTVGDIRTEDIQHIAEHSRQQAGTPLYQESFHVDKRTSCSDCEVRYFCQGGCYAEIHDNEARQDTLPPECEIKKSIILFKLWEYDKRQSFLDNLEGFIRFYEDRIHRKELNKILK
ncbi:radical SAM protein [Paenibacillus sp. FSL K6-1096]|uniref:radical SAM/SPASM domain-containing protein n=1 Tax=Paenibacillus sp. FSL K6-1096 TaxID=2921460 RepID=UPI0030EF62C3